MKPVLIAVLALGLLAPATAGAQSSPAAPAPAADYVVRAGDLLKIRVWPNAELGGEFPVEADGYVHLPEIGAVHAGGMAISTLRAELRRQYGEALRAPAVSVTPVFNVGVLGAVQRPGLYPLEPTQTVFDAISVAGGFRDNARTDRVRLVRDGQVIELNARETIERGGDEMALLLRSGDRIMVPQRWQIAVRDVLWGLQSLALVASLMGWL